MDDRRIRAAIAAAVLVLVPVASTRAQKLTDMELLGKFLFYQGISTPGSMSCAVCHGPGVGFTGPDAAGKILDRRRCAGDVLIELGQFGLECGRAPAMTLQGEPGGLQRASDIALIARDPVELGFLLLDVLPQRVGLLAQGFDGAALPGAAFRRLGVGVPQRACQAQDQGRAQAPGERWRCGC